MKTNQCSPDGPYCVGMDAILDANVRRGAQVGVMMNIQSMEQRTVVTHAAVVDGQKRQMVFSFCPCCGGRLTRESQDG